MQRRAAAVAAALFLVVGALSMGIVTTASAPEIDLADDNEFREGDRFSYADEVYTVASIEATESEGETTYEAVIEWNDESMNGTQSASVSQHGNVTLSGDTFFAHFDSGEEVVISADFATLRQYDFDTQQYNTHTSGLWGVTILSGVVALLLLGTAYLPSRY
jgi:hypothetical protein